MKFLFDLFPLLCFFAVYLAADIFAATAAMIVATLGQVGWLWMRKRPIEPMLWAALGIVLVFGGLTIYLNDNRFILWKPTVFYWMVSLALAAAALFFRKNLIRVLFAKAELRLPDAVWTRLNWAWSVFFALLGVANLYVAFNFSEATWVKVKTFGFTSVLFLFMVGQVLYLTRYLEEEKQ
ncbi:MAG: septation protein A [Terriglobales bacterium]